MIAISSSPTSLSKYVRFLQGNPKELCYDCWKKEMELGDGKMTGEHRI